MPFCSVFVFLFDYITAWLLFSYSCFLSLPLLPLLLLLLLLLSSFLIKHISSFPFIYFIFHNTISTDLLHSLCYSLITNSISWFPFIFLLFYSLYSITVFYSFFFFFTDLTGFRFLYIRIWDISITLQNNSKWNWFFRSNFITKKYNFNTKNRIKKSIIWSIKNIKKRSKII